MRRALVATLVLTGALAGAACGSSGTAGGPGAAASTTVAAPATTVVAVVRDILASEVDPPGAPGRTLTLVRYTIAPGAKLAAHVHPGVQLASIQSGSLSYTVISGTATVKRAGGTTESVVGPAAITLGERPTVPGSPEGVRETSGAPRTFWVRPHEASAAAGHEPRSWSANAARVGPSRARA